jgi:hydroxypyruvate reductase
MAAAIATQPQLTLRTVLAIGTHRDASMPAHVEWHVSSHPLPDTRSVNAAERALAVAHSVARDEALVILLSGGASALMALPIAGLTIDEKQAAVRALMLAGADIQALNTVRKHLSAVKGGRLAAACAGTTVTLAVSDVVGDDLSVIGSGPGLADPTTWADAQAVLRRYDVRLPTVMDIVMRGVRGDVADTPKPGDPAIARTHAMVIASRRHALDAARVSASELGYHVTVIPDDVTGEARDVARPWLARAIEATRNVAGPACVLSAGETTVRVVGQGRGGRNQEFVLALADVMVEAPPDTIVASVGTDGIDGPTDAAGALVDGTTLDRADTMGLDPRAMLADNDAYDFFALLGDLIHFGRTDTNVGDVQVMLRR